MMIPSRLPCLTKRLVDMVPHEAAQIRGKRARMTCPRAGRTKKSSLTHACIHGASRRAVIPSSSGRQAVDPCAFGRVRWIFARWAGAWARAVETICLLMHLQLRCYRYYYREYILPGEQQDYWVQEQGQGLYGALGIARVHTSSQAACWSCNNHREPLSEARASLRSLVSSR